MKNIKYLLFALSVSLVLRLREDGPTADDHFLNYTIQDRTTYTGSHGRSPLWEICVGR